MRSVRVTHPRHQPDYERRSRATPPRRSRLDCVVRTQVAWAQWHPDRDGRSPTRATVTFGRNWLPPSNRGSQETSHQAGGARAGGCLPVRRLGKPGRSPEGGPPGSHPMHSPAIETFCRHRSATKAGRHDLHHPLAILRTADRRARKLMWCNGLPPPCRSALHERFQIRGGRAASKGERRSGSNPTPRAPSKGAGGTRTLRIGSWWLLSEIMVPAHFPARCS